MVDETQVLPLHGELDGLRLYVSHACPFAHRVLIGLALTEAVHRLPVRVVEPVMGPQGWVLDPPDARTGATTLRDICSRAQPGFEGRATVPMLYDARADRILSRDSMRILRWIDQRFGRGADTSLFAPELEPELGALSRFIAEAINHGVYDAGFATTQHAHDRAVERLFSALALLEKRLPPGPSWLFGDRLTAADIQLFTTLVRFDRVYHTLFKCNWRHAFEHPRLWALAQRLHGLPGVADTVRLEDIAQHYYRSLPALNPSGIVPRGPELPWSARSGIAPQPTVPGRGAPDAGGATASPTRFSRSSTSQ